MTAQAVHVTRAKLYPVVARPGPAWRWTYSYAADGGPVVEYGTGLASLRSMLRRTFPGAVVTFDWNSNTAPPARSPR